MSDVDIGFFLFKFFIFFFFYSQSMHPYFHFSPLRINLPASRRDRSVTAGLNRLRTISFLFCDMTKKKKKIFFPDKQMQYVSHSAHLNSRRLSPKQYPSTENYRNGVRPQRYVLCSKCKRLNSGSRELVYSTKELDGFRFCRRFNDSPRSHFSSPTIIEKLLKGELNGLKKKKKKFL